MKIRRAFYSLPLIILLLVFCTEAFAKNYSYEVKEHYTYHYFGFNKDEVRKISKGPYKAKEYGDWILEELEGSLAGMSAGLAKLTGRAKLDFELTSMARAAERERLETLQIEFRTYDDGTGNWVLELHDSTKDEWKKLTE